MDKPKRGAKKKQTSGSKVSRASRKSRRSKRQSRVSRKVILPKTIKLPSKRSDYRSRKKFSRANSSMNITELQFLAKSRGIPFGGLTKTKLIRKINNYY